MSSTPAPITDREPVVTYTAIATVVAAIAATVGITVDPSTLLSGALGVVAFGGYIVAAFKARKKVSPVV